MHERSSVSTPHRCTSLPRWVRRWLRSSALAETSNGGRGRCRTASSPPPTIRAGPAATTAAVGGRCPSALRRCRSSACTPRSCKCSPIPSTARRDEARDHSPALYALRGRRAFRRSCARSAARARHRDHAVYAALAADTSAVDRARTLQSALPRPPLARLGIRPCSLRHHRPTAAGAGAVARALVVLRRVSGGRRRAPGLARGAAARRAYARAPLRRMESVSPLRAGNGAAPLREPGVARGNLQLEDGARRNSRTLRRVRGEALRHL